MGQFARTEYQTPSVADESALSDIWVAREEDGSLVWVQSTQSYYSLNKSSGAVAVVGSVVAPRAGAPIAGFSAARWTRQTSGGSSTTFGTQPTWYIDPVSGNDNNTGLTAPTALKTLTELARRLNEQSLNQQTDVYILSSTPASDNFYLTCAVLPLGVLTIHGTPTTLHTGSITAVTNLNPGASTPSSITDAAVGDWAPFVGRRIRLTNGAQAGAMAWIAARTAATVARTSPWEQFNGSTPPYSVAPIDPVNAPNGSAYVVEELTSILGSVLLDISAPDTFDPTWGSLRFMLVDLQFFGDKPSIASRGGSGGQLLAAAHCDVTTMVVLAGSMRYFNCGFVATEILTGTTVEYQGGLNYQFIVSVHEGSLCSVRGTLFQGIQLRVVGTLVIAGASGLAIFDAASPALLVEPGALVRDGLAWGTGNAGVGIQVRSGGSFVYQTKPTLTGTSDTLIGGAATAYAGIPLVTAANNAMMVADA